MQTGTGPRGDRPTTAASACERRQIACNLPRRCDIPRAVSRFGQARSPERVLDLVVPAVSVAAALALWELVTRTGVISPKDLSPMTTTFSELWRLARTGTFWTQLGDTVRGWALGLAIATALAVPLGILLGASEFASSAFRVPIEFLRPIPSAVLIPLLFLTLGTKLRSEIFLASFGAFWPLLVQ